MPNLDGSIREPGIAVQCQGRLYNEVIDVLFAQIYNICLD